MTIAVVEYTKKVNVGARGRVLVQIAGAQPIVALRVRLAIGSASIVAGEVLGQELRDLAGLYFSVPRTRGTYNLTVSVTDTQGCVATTTSARPLTVQ